MKKYFANIITSLRIIGSIALLFFSLQSRLFYIIYLVCGLTDMIDGAIARKLNICSIFGSKLDTVADFLFITVCSIKLIPVLNIPILLWIWITEISFIKIINIVLGFIKTKKFVDLHTILNKVTGLLLFFLPLTFHFIELTYSFVVVCTIANIVAIQESYYIIKAKDR